MTDILIKRGDLERDAYRGKLMRGYKEKVVVCKPKREASEETSSADILIWDSWPPELWENKFPLFKPLSLHYFVIAALAN